MKKSSIILVVVIVIAILLALTAWALRGGQSTEESDDTNFTSNNYSSDDSSSTNSSNNEPDNPDSPVSNLVVTYGGSSFSPDTMTVAQGDTVTFRNDSSTDVWPASDDHPTHTNLSGFDPQRGLGPGEEYSFTFSEVGEWGYHNHLNPGQTGTIIVE